MSDLDPEKILAELEAARKPRVPTARGRVPG